MAKRKIWLRKTAPLIFNVSELNAFRKLLVNSERIKLFLEKDSCFMLADRYLLASVLIYMKRAQLDVSHYTEYNFFVCLYIAHDFFEDISETKWDILPWALQTDWYNIKSQFYQRKIEILTRMNMELNVTITQARQVCAMLKCEVLNARIRHESHGGIWDTDYEDQKVVVPNPTDPKGACPKCKDMKDSDIFCELDDEI